MIWATVEVNFAIVSGRSTPFLKLSMCCTDLTVSACLPLMRPVARRLLPGSVLASSDPQSYGKSGGTNGIKLRTVTRTVEINGGDDSSSTKNLADAEAGTSDDENGAFGGAVVHRTVIASAAGEYDDTPEQMVGPSASSKGGGIHVKNEMSISYERV